MDINTKSNSIDTNHLLPPRFKRANSPQTDPMPTEGRHLWEVWVNRIGEHILWEEPTLAGRFCKSLLNKIIFF